MLNPLLRFMLSLLAYCSFVQATIVVTGAPLIASYDDQQLHNGFPQRREIHEFSQSGPAFHLYIAALGALQARRQVDPQSYFQIAGIHGWPAGSWDGVEGLGSAPGYCPHHSVTFPTWHRVYMALFEQNLCDIAQKFARTYPFPQREIYKEAARSFRMPYWDWLVHPKLPPVASTPEIRIELPGGWKTVPNPLYNYTFHPGPEGNGLPIDKFPFAELPWTVRWYDEGTGESNLSRADRSFQHKAPLMRAATHMLFNHVARFNNFACFHDQASTNPNENIEIIHNAIHAAVGGENSHIKETSLAAFDPLFYLHHANTDRLFALWQIAHPDTRFEAEVNNAGSYAVPTGTIETIDSPLFPFRSDMQGGMWTSRQVWDLSVLNYTYPELAAMNQTSVEDRRAWVREYMSTTYYASFPHVS